MTISYMTSPFHKPHTHTIRASAIFSKQTTDCIAAVQNIMPGKQGEIFENLFIKIQTKCMWLLSDILHNYKRFINVQAYTCKDSGKLLPSLTLWKRAIWESESYLPLTQYIPECSASILFKVTCHPHFTDGQSKQERAVIWCFSLLLLLGSSEMSKLLLFIEMT